MGRSPTQSSPSSWNWPPTAHGFALARGLLRLAPGAGRVSPAGGRRSRAQKPDTAAGGRQVGRHNVHGCHAAGRGRAVDAGKRASAVADSDDELKPRRRFFGARLLKRLFAVAVILTGAWFAYVWRADLGKFIGALGTASPTSVMAATDRNGVDVPPLRGFGLDAAQMDANFAGNAPVAHPQARISRLV